MILAVLGLLVALVPLASAGAVAGTVTLSGGEKGKYFSDQTDDNIVTIKVTDADLTPLRRGTARSLTATGPGLELGDDFVVAGEKERTQRFDGGLNNPICDHDYNNTDGTRNENSGDTAKQRITDAQILLRDADPVTDAYTGGPDCADAGDATEVPGADTTLDSDGNAANGDETADNGYRFDLKDMAVARDLQSGTASGVGEIGTNDIMSVVVNGRTAVRSTDNAAAPANAGGGPWYQIVQQGSSDVASGLPLGGGVDGRAAPGEGIVAVIVKGLAPQDAENSVSITFKITEFDFAGGTPIDLEETRVRFGASGDSDYSTVNNQVNVSTTSGDTVTTTGSVAGAVIVSFGYDVEDSYAADKSMVTLNSASAGDVRLAIDETGPATDVFEAEVVVFSQDDHSKIVTESKDMMNDAVANNGNGDEKVTIGELNNTNGLSGTDDTGDRSLWSRVTDSNTLDDLGLTTDSEAEALLAKAIPARHDDIINVTYRDADPSAAVSKSATVDLEAPVVTLISPSHNFYTNVATVTMSAEVTDTGAGVDPAFIELSIDNRTTGLSRSAAVESPIENGYRVTAAAAGTISEGTKQWFVGVEDKVGNVPPRDIVDSNKRADGQSGACGGDNPACGTGPVGVNEAPRGAAAFNAGTADNAFKFTVDTRAPTLSSGKTGVSLRNPGVTSGTNKETERPNQNTWVRAAFNVGDGGAPLDPATVSASDFHVDGAMPLDYKINSVDHTDGTQEIDKGTAVYLQVGALDSDARPEVELVGEVKDRAGNTRTEGRLASISDGLAPVLTVTPSADIAKDEITLTISSDENLRTNPEVQLTQTKPEKGEDLVSPATQPVSLQVGGLTTWTGTFKNTPGQASIRYVAVTASDSAGNEAKKGFAATETDFVSFQVDSAPPKLVFKSAGGKDLDTSTAADKPQEGAVWIVMEFDEDEHAGDKYRKVEVTALTLTNLADDSVVTDDVTQVFGSEVTCDDHAAEADADPVPQDKCAQRTLAIDLTPGEYNIKVTGVDQSGNSVTANTDFEVVEAKPFTLTLRPGQNFISIPGMPMGDGGDIDTMLADAAITSVSTYDRALELAGENPWLRSSKDLETGMFSGDISAIEPGKAYFINSTASVTVKVKLQAAGDLPPVIPVRQGYNAIGFWSVSGDTSAEIDLYLGSIGWSVAYTYDPTPGVGWTVLRKGGFDAEDNPLEIEEGKGYLVYALYDAVLTP